MPRASTRSIPNSPSATTLSFYPFFLDGVAAEATLNLDDGMHPNEAGVDRIVENILPAVEELIARINGEG